jgi:DNA-binding response OmpR family regulator
MSPSPSTQHAAILVVEDEVLVRVAVADELRQQGHGVIEAASTDEALRVLRSELAVDLVITDVRMAGSLDGISLIRTIKSEFPGVKLLLALDREARTASGIEADGFFTKPYPFPELLQQIETLLQPGSRS